MPKDVTLKVQVPLVDLKSQYETIKSEINEAIEGVLSSGSYILGSNVRHLEDELARYCGVKCAVGVASGTDALVLALSALGIGREDEVITTPLLSLLRLRLLPRWEPNLYLWISRRRVSISIR